MRAEVPTRAGEWAVRRELESSEPRSRVAELWDCVPALLRAKVQTKIDETLLYLQPGVIIPYPETELLPRLALIAPLVGRPLERPLACEKLRPLALERVLPALQDERSPLWQIHDVLALTAAIAAWDHPSLPPLSAEHLTQLANSKKARAGWGTQWWHLYLIAGPEYARSHIASQQTDTGWLDDWTPQAGEVDDPADLHYLALRACLYPEYPALPEAWWETVLTRLQSEDWDTIMGDSKSSRELYLVHLTILAAGGIEQGSDHRWRLRDSSTSAQQIAVPARRKVQHACLRSQLAEWYAR